MSETSTAATDAVEPATLGIVSEDKPGAEVLQEEPSTLKQEDGGRDCTYDDVACGPRAVLTILSSIVNTSPAASETDKNGPAATWDKVLGTRFLLSLFALDACSWGTGKIFQYEVLLLADDPKLAWCYVIVSLVMTTAEIFTEFVASALTPCIFQCVQTRGHMTSKQLVHFALKTYTFSNWFALLVYPWFGVAVHGLDHLSAGIVYGLAVTRTLQYAFCNQLGDCSIEMAKAHWMTSFKNTDLRFPGLCCKCYCQITRPASSKVVALYLAIVRYITFGAIAVVYVSVRKKTALRWSLAGALLIWNAFAPLLLLKHWKRITRGIGENEIEKEESVKAMGPLRWNELSFLFFVVVLKGVPPQAQEAFQSILVIELSSKVQQGGLFLAFLLIMSALIYKIYCVPTTARSTQMIKAKGRGSGSAIELVVQSWFLREWLYPVIIIGILLVGGATCVGAGKKAMLYVALVIFLPVAPLYQVLKAAMDTFYLRYDELRSTNLVYWENVLQVAINAPILAANWLAVEAVGCDDTDGAEERAAQVLLYLTAGLLLLTCIYYGAVDLYCMSSKASLAALVDATHDDVVDAETEPDIVNGQTSTTI